MSGYQALKSVHRFTLSAVVHVNEPLLSARRQPRPWESSAKGRRIASIILRGNTGKEIKYLGLDALWRGSLSHICTLNEHR